MKLRNNLSVIGTIAGINLVENEDVNGNLRIYGSLSINTAKEDEIDNLIRLSFYAPKFKKQYQAGEEKKPLRTYTALKSMLDNPEGNIGRKINIAGSVSENIFESNGNLVETVQYRGAFINDVRPNDKFKAIISADALIEKEPIEMEDRDGELIKEDGKVKYRSQVTLFNDFSKIAIPMSVVMLEDAARWVESVADQKEIYPVQIQLVNAEIKNKREIENAFGGDALVVEETTSVNERKLIWASPEPVDMEDKDFVAEAKKNYELKLSSMKNAEAVKAEQAKKVMEAPVTEEKSTDASSMDFEW